MNPGDYERVRRFLGHGPEGMTLGRGTIPWVSIEDSFRIDYDAINSDMVEAILRKYGASASEWLYYVDQCPVMIYNPHMGEEQAEIVFDLEEEAKKELRLDGYSFSGSPLETGENVPISEMKPLTDLRRDAQGLCSCWVAEAVVWALLRSGKYVKPIESRL